jgi:photosystem II stability/assembly factor-like uncharacterized protein
MAVPILQPTCTDSVSRIIVPSGPHTIVHPPEGGFYAVAVLDRYNIWAVGREGDHLSANRHAVILNSTDFGYTWMRKAIVPNQELLNIYFSNSLNGWAVGWGGLILRTTDGGNTWTRQKPPVGDEYLKSVMFISDKKGWVIGFNGQVLRTSDGGSSWRSQMLPAGWTGREFRGWLNNFSFADEYNGWVVGDQNQIYQSTDGGASWQSRSSQVRPLIKTKRVRRVNYKEVRFFNKDVGYIIAEIDNDFDSSSPSPFRKLAVLKTENGGRDWGLRRILEAHWLLRVQFLSEREWWMEIQWEQPPLLHTTDGGMTWSEVNIPADLQLDVVVFLDLNNWLSLSYRDGFSGSNMRTHDGGKTWVRYQIRYLR